MKRTLSLVLAVFLLTSLYLQGLPPSPPPHKPNIWELVNAYRRDQGLHPLIPDQQLVASAKAKCDHMQAHNYWSHDAPDRQWQTFLPRRPIVGENLAKNYPDDQATVEGWKNSPAHNDNLLRPVFKKMGVVVCDGPTQRLTVQHFSS